MAKTLNVNYEGKHCYYIELRDDFNDIINCIESLNIKAKRLCVVTDSNVAELHLNNLLEVLRAGFSDLYFTSYTIPAGEENKTLDNVQKIYEHLVLEHFDRYDMLIALGGGVIGDMTGFTAATYMRGIDFIQVPTSLLSQVDSSIGGKTGVDFLKYKNMVGAFYMPRLVYMNLSVLKTLPAEQFSSGMGEIIKHGLIKNKGYYNWLKGNAESVNKLDMEALETMIYESCKVKRDVVERDPKEQGERALLNFGHTAGHAIEKCANFSLYHGHCVGIGINVASYISMKLGNISESEYEDILNTLKLYNMPIKALSKDMLETVFETTRSDKKMVGDKVKFILLNAIGEAYITKELTKEQISEGIEIALN